MIPKITIKVFRHALILSLLTCRVIQADAQSHPEPLVAVGRKLPELQDKLKPLIVQGRKLAELAAQQSDLSKMQKQLKEIRMVGTDQFITQLDIHEAVPVPGYPLVPEPAVPGNLQPPSQPSGAGAAERTRSILRTFRAGSKDKLQIDNQFGNIEVNTWSKNEMRVQIEIKAFEGSEERAEELLQTVSIAEAKSGNLISFRTDIARAGANNWFGMRKNNGREERRGVQITYTVTIPAKSPLDLTDKYGTIHLPDLSGELNIKCSYGSLRAGKLTHPANRIKVAYGSANVDALNSASVEISYGSLKLGQAERLNAEVKYSSAQIGKLSGNGDIQLKYAGGFKIAEVDRNVKNLNVNAAYSQVALGFDPASAFDFDVTVSYAGFNYDKAINIQSKSPENNGPGFQPTKNYKGQIGKGSEAKVVVNSKYGSVRFN